MKLAFVFPGQGSQTIGMMNGFADHPVVRATFAEAAAALVAALEFSKPVGDTRAAGTPSRWVSAGREEQFR